MSELKATPGPWKVEKELSSRSSEWLIAMDCGDRGRGIAIAETVPATGTELANARLIAAAPELYESNQELARHVVELCAVMGVPVPSDSLERHRAASAKSRGEQP